VLEGGRNRLEAGRGRRRSSGSVLTDDLERLVPMAATQPTFDTLFLRFMEENPGFGRLADAKEVGDLEMQAGVSP
jgi:hypothetical protein